jgi:hypothetical protein
MSNEFLTGAWTYRSFYNLPESAEDFNKLKLAEADLTFESYSEPGELRGQMAFRSNPPEKNDARLMITGSAQTGNPFSIHMRGIGVAGTEAEGWIYEQVGYFVPRWPSSDDQRPAIVGSVSRMVPHSDGHGGMRPAGFVGSFIAVKRDTPEPREVIPLPKLVISMLAAREHRLHHSVWHAVRNMWPSLSERKKDAIRALSWQPGPAGGSEKDMRPAAVNRVPFLQNGSGEDFLFMHRQVITMVRDQVQHLGLPAVESWKIIPPPGPVSIEPNYSVTPVKLPPPGNPDGFAVMPAWAEPSDEGDARRQAALKSDAYYWSHMFPASQKFQDPGYLATLDKEVSATATELK